MNISHHQDDSQFFLCGDRHLFCIQNLPPATRP